MKATKKVPSPAGNPKKKAESMRVRKAAPRSASRRPSKHGAAGDDYAGEADLNGDDSGRMRRHPSALEEGDPSEEHTRPVDDELHAAIAPPTSGTLSSIGESETLPVGDPGLSLEPEQLGRQFLRDATEQDNFESNAHWPEQNPAAYPLGQLISEASLESAGQEGMAVPASDALSTGDRDGTPDDADFEPTSHDVELMSTAVHEVSLFDEVTERDGTRAPSVASDELEATREQRTPPGADEDAHDAEVRRLRAKLRKHRDRGQTDADRATWEETRRADETDGKATRKDPKE